MDIALRAPITWAIVTPLAAATLLFVLGPRRGAPVRVLALAAQVVATAGLVHEVRTRGPWRYPLGDWDAPLGIVLYADGLSVFLFTVNAVVGLLVSVYAFGYLPRQHKSEEGTVASFWPLWFFLWLGLSGLYLSGDLFNLYVTLELIGASAVGLIALARGPALAASIRYVLVTLFGSLAYLAGVGLLYAQYGVVDMALLGHVTAPGPTTYVALAFMTLGMFLKTAIFPLHVWLPPAHAGALGPVSAILSALVVKASFYLTVRLWTTVFPAVASASLADVAGALGVIAIVWGSVQAMRQRTLKMLVAYSTVAQMGYLALVFPLALSHPDSAPVWAAGLYFVATHACAKAAMFLAASTLKHELGDDRLERMRGMSVRAPLTLFSLGLAGISLIGLPPTGGFLAKWMLLSAAVDSGQWVLAVVMVSGSLLAAGYVFPVLSRSLREPTRPEERRPLRVPASMELSTFVLAILGVLLGLLSREPLALLDIGRPFAGVAEHSP